MKNIPPLYHWSPSRFRNLILTQGLRPTTPHHGVLTVCLGDTPLDAWALSGAMRPPEDWDLYEVHVADTQVYRVKHWGRWAEYRIPRAIHPRGVTYLATKTKEEHR